jgi:hypothetical protein
MQRPCFKVQSRVSKPPLTASINGSGARRSGLRNASCGRIGTVRDDLEPQHPASIDTTSDATAHVKSGEAPEPAQNCAGHDFGENSPQLRMEASPRAAPVTTTQCPEPSRNLSKTQNQYRRAMRHAWTIINRHCTACSPLRNRSATEPMPGRPWARLSHIRRQVPLTGNPNPETRSKGGPTLGGQAVRPCGMVDRLR